jgi:hypothetical protein
MFEFMDVIEVHPPAAIFTVPSPAGKTTARNPIFHWMQLLNLGYRITGVVNTDAHYNFHESGWLRNYLKSDTDNPAEIKTLDMVHAAEAGHVVMTNGPFLTVQVAAKNPAPPTPRRLKHSGPPAKSVGIPGDNVYAPHGEAMLHIRVQCPNWLDINRVQVFLNGRAAKDLNFTRRDTPRPFGDGVVKFDTTVPLALTTDTHIIVAAAGEGLTLSPIMGPQHGTDMPIAVSNPIFVEHNDNGFQPNRDELDVPLPRK